MRSLVRTCFLCILLCCFLFPLHSSAQVSASDSAMRASAIDSAIMQYHQFISNVAPLYSGTQYVDYDLQIQVGHPFFQSSDFNMGSIMYDNVLYEQIPLKYDLVKNEVVIKDPSGAFKLTLFNERIGYFKVLSHTFIKIAGDSSVRQGIRNGFYDQLYNGRSFMLLKKESKEVLDDLNAFGGPKRIISSTANFYIKKNNMYYSVSSRGDVLDIFADRADEIRQLIRKRKLNFRTDRETALTEIAVYYDTFGK